MIIIAGLGNPGGKYDATRHNVGFHVIDALAAAHQTQVNQRKFKSLFTEIRMGTGGMAMEKVLLVKPQTFMNLSGESIGHWMRYYDLEPRQLLVVYDDMDFEPGEVRLRQKGSAGSHNGMKSIVQHLGTTEFPRLRVGIGKPIWQNAASYVLSRLTPEEMPLIQEAITQAAEAAECFVKEGIDAAMNKYNQRYNPPLPLEAAAPAPDQEPDAKLDAGPVSDKDSVPDSDREQ